MHELPKDLTSSLRSWRGSIYGNSTSDKVIDVEKGQEDYGEKEFERALSPDESSVILHPTLSTQGLNQARQQQSQQQGQQYSRSDEHHLRHIHSQGQLGSQQQHQQSRLSIAHPLSPQTTVARRQGTLPPATPASAVKSVFTAPKVADPDPAADRLDDDLKPLEPANFYELMGMRPPVSKDQNPKELAIRNGLYSRIQSQLRKTSTQFHAFDILAYVFLLLQILLSAAFIVLGSIQHANTRGVAIVVLGAISTVIGGLLALMKGQGLPNRLRQTRDGLKNVIFEAEELYWDVGADRPVLFKDVKKVRQDFIRVLEQARKNHPDFWNTTDEGVAKGIQAASGKKPTLAHGATPKP